ncbi:hypothetical protein GCM10020219_070060 [Nonomuraea dietziae]
MLDVHRSHRRHAGPQLLMTRRAHGPAPEGPVLPFGGKAGWNGGMEDASGIAITPRPEASG